MTNPIKKVVGNALSKILYTNAVQNTAIFRQQVLDRLSNTGRDIDNDCGYPADIDKGNFFAMYERNGIAARVVNIFAEDCWTQMPLVVETSASGQTDFEKAWKKLQREKNLLAYLSRVDQMSGIGRFGILLMGFNDSQKLDRPLRNIDEKTGLPKTGKPSKELELTFLKPLGEDAVTIDKLEDDSSSARYGLPKTYSIQFNDVKNKQAINSKVHWTRVLHIADNREESDTFGVSRLRNVYNYLLDTKKVGGGSGEMFWKGGFPGYSFEVAPTKDGVTVEVDKESVQDEIEDYSQGLQRYMILENLTAKSLAPQVADPSAHMESLIKSISMAKGIPFRIFLGTEEGKLAGSQDKALWNARIRKRQEIYLSPFVIRPLVYRLMAVGALPTVDDFMVEWPDLSSPSDRDKAETANIRTEALVKYVQGEVETLIPPREYFKIFLEMDEDTIDVIDDASEKYEDVLEEKKEDEDERAIKLADENQKIAAKNKPETLPRGQQTTKGAKESNKAKRPDGD